MSSIASSQVGDFWRASMDTDAIERAGAAPLGELLALVYSAASGATPVAEAVAALHASGAPVFFSVGDGPDAKKSSWSIAQIHQGGLGLPDRDYYFDEDKAEIRSKCVVPGRGPNPSWN